MVFAGEKVKGPRRDEVADELAAFANARGGVLVLGVDDATTGDCRYSAGATRSGGTVRSASWCSDLIKPHSFLSSRSWSFPAADGQPRPVIKVDVPRSLFVHQSPGGDFYRVGSAKRRMDTDI